MDKYILIGAGLLALAACTKEVPGIPETVTEESSVEAALTFTAGLESTKAALSDGKVAWKSGDEIAVWNGKSMATFRTEEEGATATFTTTDTAFEATGDYTAVYPASAAAASFADGVSVTLPASQAAAAGTFDPEAHLAVATSSDATLSFRNLVSYVKFTVPAGMDDLKSVTFQGNGNEPVAGTAASDPSAPALSVTGDGSSVLSGSFAAGSSYYLAVAPRQYAQGYTLTLERSSGSYEMVSTKDVAYTRSVARNIGNLWDGSYVLDGTAVEESLQMLRLTLSNVNVTNKESVYSYRGTFSAGTLSLHPSYTGTPVVGGISIPDDGKYHVLYNATTGKVRVYAQDAYLHVGYAATESDEDTYNKLASGNLYYPAEAWAYVNWLNKINVAKETSVSLLDYYQEETGIVVTVPGSLVANNQTPPALSTGRKNNNCYVDDDFYPIEGWCYGVKLANVKTGDTFVNSGPVAISITGLAAGSYDVRIASTRYGTSSTGVRQTRFTIDGISKTVDNWVNQRDFKTNVATFDSVSTTGSISIEMEGVATEKSSEAALNFIYISKVVYSRD